MYIDTNFLKKLIQRIDKVERILCCSSDGGSGVVNPGAINTLAYYAAAGTTLSSLAAMNPNEILISDANGLPIGSGLPVSEIYSYTENLRLQTIMNNI